MSSRQRSTSLGRLILFCDRAAGRATWAHLGGTPYSVNGTAQSLTPQLKTVLDAPPEVFRKSGLDSKSFQEQVEAMAVARSAGAPRSSASRETLSKAK